jgi:branched-chain amino acid transport system permease protein
MNTLLSRNLGRGLAVVAALVVGYFVPGVFGGDSAYTTAVLIAIFAIMSYGNDVILSYLGEVSLGQTVFWAAGAYFTAIFVLKSGWGPLPSLVVSLLISLAIAVVLGLATLRTREFVFSLVTYAAAIIAAAVVGNWSLFGGSDGLVGLPLLQISLPGLSWVAYSNQDFWPIAYLCLVIVIGFVARFRRARLGVTSLMAHMNSGLATTMGVDVRRTRLMVFVVSAPISALAGWLYAYQRSYVGPDLLSQYFLLLMLTAVVLPGKRLLLGPLVGTVVLVVLQQNTSLNGNVYSVVLGGILAVVLLTSPNGLIGWWQLLTRLRHRTQDHAHTASGSTSRATADEAEPASRHSLATIKE